MSLTYTPSGTIQAIKKRERSDDVWLFPYTVGDLRWSITIRRTLKSSSVRVIAYLACDKCDGMVMGKTMAETLNNGRSCKHPTVNGATVRPKWNADVVLAFLTVEKTGGSVYPESIPHNVGNKVTASDFLLRHAKMNEYDLIVFWSTMFSVLGDLALHPKQNWWKK